MHKDCVGLRKTGLPALNRKNQHGVPLSIKKLSRTTPTGQGTASFLQWNKAGSTNHTPEPAPCLGVVDKHKMNSMTFLKVWTFFFVFFCYGSFSLLPILIFAFMFSFCLFLVAILKERESYVGREVKRIWEEL